MLGPWTLAPLALRGAQGPAVKNMRFRVQRLMRFRFRVRVRWSFFSDTHLISMN